MNLLFPIPQNTEKRAAKMANEIFKSLLSDVNK